MSIGVLCEGPLSDVPALEIILKHLFPQTKFEIHGRDKKDIYLNADYFLTDLHNKGANNILVLWDLDPPGHQMPVPAQKSAKICQYEQRQTLLNSLCSSDHLLGVLRKQAQEHASRYRFPPYHETPVSESDPSQHLFALVCVPTTFESWLLADGNVLMKVASTEIRPAPRYNPPHPDRCTEPEAVLKRYFKQCPNRYLQDFNKHSPRYGNKYIAQAYIQAGRVETMLKSQSFSRMVQILRQWGAR